MLPAFSKSRLLLASNVGQQNAVAILMVGLSSVRYASVLSFREFDRHGLEFLISGPLFIIKVAVKYLFKFQAVLNIS
jgi:hypothetical protein